MNHLPHVNSSALTQYTDMPHASSPSLHRLSKEHQTVSLSPRLSYSACDEEAPPMASSLKSHRKRKDIKRIENAFTCGNRPRHRSSTYPTDSLTETTLHRSGCYLCQWTSTQGPIWPPTYLQGTQPQGSTHDVLPHCLPKEQQTVSFRFLSQLCLRLGTPTNGTPH